MKYNILKETQDGMVLYNTNPLYSEDYEEEDVFGDVISRNVLAIPQKSGKTN